MSDTKPADEIRIGRVKATIWMNTALLHGSSRRMPYHRVFKHRG